MNLRDEWKTVLETKVLPPRIEEKVSGLNQTSSRLVPMFLRVLQSMYDALLARLQKEKDQVQLYHHLRVLNPRNLPDGQLVARSNSLGP